MSNVNFKMNHSCPEPVAFCPELLGVSSMNSKAWGSQKVTLHRIQLAGITGVKQLWHWSEPLGKHAELLQADDGLDDSIRFIYTRIECIIRYMQAKRMLSTPCRFLRSFTLIHFVFWVLVCVYIYSTRSLWELKDHYYIYATVHLLLYCKCWIIYVWFGLVQSLSMLHESTLPPIGELLTTAAHYLRCISAVHSSGIYQNSIQGSLNEFFSAVMNYKLALIFFTCIKSCPMHVCMKSVHLKSRFLLPAVFYTHWQREQLHYKV